MSLTRSEKEKILADVLEQVAKSKTLSLARYIGLKVSELDILRKKAREMGVFLHVVKNTLVRKAVTSSKFEVAVPLMQGPIIYAFSQDAVASAKLLADFSKTNQNLVLVGGVYEGSLLDEAALKELASIPSKEVLISRLLGLLLSPITRLAAVLGALAKEKTV